MSVAFILFILWLSLTGLVGLLPAQYRPLARFGLLAASPVLMLLTLFTQGWFPALMVLVAGLTVFPSEWARLTGLARQAASQRRQPEFVQPAGDAA